MKQKTNKLKKLEQNRYSIFEDKSYRCYYCHRTGTNFDFHEVYGGSNRIRSIKNGLCVHLCRSCHSNEMVLADLKKWCQKQYEKTHSRQEFINLIGKSYI